MLVSTYTSYSMSVLQTYYYLPNQEYACLKLEIDQHNSRIVPVSGKVVATILNQNISVRTNSLYIAHQILVELPKPQLLHFLPCGSHQEMCVRALLKLVRNNQELICYIDSPLHLEKMLRYSGCKKFFSWYSKSTS